MEVELVQGCICDAYEVDGKSVNDFTMQELNQLLKKQFEYALEKGEWDALYRLSYHLAEDFYDNLETSEPCECCGDSIWTYKTHLENGTI
jgi:hypothetical protein